jgi:hypothetical protein
MAMAAGAASAPGAVTVLFYPDGTTSTAVVAVTNERNKSIEVSLRGLTGAVHVGPVESVGQQ